MSINIGFFHVLIIIGSCCLLSCEAQDLKGCKFDAIYQMGDSLSDTGNSIIEIPPAYHARFPYGETIHNATGRPSDGLLVIDFIAQSAGLPLLPPYEKTPNATFDHGADFAVAGVRAMDVDTLLRLNLSLGFSNSSLKVQLGWLKQVLSTKCNDTKDCQEKLKSSLFMVGEIGANDIWDSLGGYGIDRAREIILPEVTNAVIDGVQEVISYGASKIVVPGIYPLGCSPSLLSSSETNKSVVYDSLGCLKDFNDLFLHYNNQLQIALEKSRKNNPNVTIVYSDVYNAAMYILNNLTALGFKEFKITCCGIGGEHHFSPELNKTCGAQGVPVCPNPLEYVFFDGGHFTHHANQVLSEQLIKELLPKLQCTV